MRSLARFLACSPRGRPPAGWARRRRAASPAAVARPLTLVALVTLAVGSFACGDASFKPGALVDQQELFWNLELNHHAILLSTRAPYDTLRLVATPRNYHGDVLPGLAPTFRSEDRTKVIVSPDGLLQALAPMPLNTVVRIIATLTASNLRHADTAYVRVTDADPLPMVGSISIHPIPPDSAKVAARSEISPTPLHLRVTDVGGVPMPAFPGDTEGAGVLPVDFRTSDTSIILLNDGSSLDRSTTSPGILGRRPGTATLYATTTAFGVIKTDTLPYRIGLPLFIQGELFPSGSLLTPNLMVSSNVFIDPDVQIGVGGIVNWVDHDDSNLVADVVFREADLPNILSATPWPNYSNDPILEYGGYTGTVRYFLLCTPLGLYGKSDCVNSGDFVLGPIAGGVGYGSVVRKFVTPGTYEYSSTLHPGSHGRVVVVDER